MSRSLQWGIPPAEPKILGTASSNLEYLILTYLNIGDPFHQVRKDTLAVDGGFPVACTPDLLMFLHGARAVTASGPDLDELANFVDALKQHGALWIGVE